MTPEEIAIFIRQEYRVQEAHDSTIKARFTGARQITIDTNLDGASALVVATEYQSSYGAPVLAFDIDIEGTLRFEDFIPAPPQFNVTIRDVCTSRPMRVVGISNDEFKGTSTITVMG